MEHTEPLIKAIGKVVCVIRGGPEVVVVVGSGFFFFNIGGDEAQVHVVKRDS